MPVITSYNVEEVLGGAANVARNIVALGGSCTLLGVIGADEVGRTITRLLGACARMAPKLTISESRVSTEKTRFVADGHHLLRADSETLGPLDCAAEQDLLAKIQSSFSDHQVIVLSDYGKGALTDTVLRVTIEMSRALGKVVIVDPKSSSFEKYAGANLITPNAKEAAVAATVGITSDSDAEIAGNRIVNAHRIDAALITRANHGMSLVQNEHPSVHIRSHAREVADVVGAGDTVVAALSLCLGSGLDYEQSARVANVAAGIVVAKQGTATVSPSELSEELGLNQVQLRAPSSKVLSASKAARVSADWRRQGLKVGFTNGCFDVLHIGHLSTIQFARRSCDRLVVGLNGDGSIRRLKGASRPINPSAERAALLASMEHVDAVVVFDDDTPLSLIQEIRPDVLVKGGDYSSESIVGAEYVRESGGSVLISEMVEGRSTTRIVEATCG